jgi:PadR family transcriptional regulator, regulatory protein PadR
MRDIARRRGETGTMREHGGHHGRGGPHHPRGRRRAGPGRFEVTARIERFVEPSLLLLLRERPMHGYELLERIGELAPQERGGRVDLGNLYRLLRALEEEGIVSSLWNDDIPGPARRTYRLTEAGARLLDEWAQALRRAREGIDAFLARYDHPEGR